MTEAEFKEIFAEYLGEWKYGRGHIEVLQQAAMELAPEKFRAACREIVENHKTNFKPSVATILGILRRPEPGYYEGPGVWASPEAFKRTIGYCKKIASCRTQGELAACYAEVERDEPNLTPAQKQTLQENIDRLMVKPDAVLGSVAMAEAAKAEARPSEPGGKTTTLASDATASPEPPPGYHEVEKLPPAVYGELVEGPDEDIPF